MQTVVHGDPVLACLPDDHSHLDHGGHQGLQGCKVQLSDLLLLQASSTAGKRLTLSAHGVFVPLQGWACLDEPHCPLCGRAAATCSFFLKLCSMTFAASLLAFVFTADSHGLHVLVI